MVRDIEIESCATIAADWLSALHRVAELLPNVSERIIVYGGSERQPRGDCDVRPLSDLGEALSRIDAGR